MGNLGNTFRRPSETILKRIEFHHQVPLHSTNKFADKRGQGIDPSRILEMFIFALGNPLLKPLTFWNQALQHTSKKHENYTLTQAKTLGNLGNAYSLNQEILLAKAPKDSSRVFRAQSEQIDDQGRTLQTSLSNIGLVYVASG